MSETKTELVLHTVALVQASILEADPRFLEFALSHLDELFKICNGCGTESSHLVPEHAWGVRLTYACYIHDFDYFLGQTEADRRYADDRFKKNLKALIAEGNMFLYPARRIRIETYYRTVRICGEKPFWQAKAINVITLTSTLAPATEFQLQGPIGNVTTNS
jgi:hypothetical protein